MNVASPELCKELYELSGWEWYGNDDTNEFSYDLGYLLRKIPKVTTLNEVANWTLSMDYNYDKTWTFHYGHQLGKRADTPEDAACKLAIELFKQGILTREDKG